MFGKSLAFCISLTFVASLSGADALPSPAKLSAAAIVDRNVAARGGLNAWRAVQTMSLAGKLGAGGNRRETLPVPDPGPPASGRRINRLPVSPRPAEEVQLPFLMELQRPWPYR